MGKVLVGITMSLDGFINDRNGDVGDLYSDLADLRETELLKESMRDTGAVVMGRRAYEMAHGDFTGYEYQVPLFVITHEAPAHTAKGENDNLTFTFVTDGIRSAISRAKDAAGDRDVVVVGGASTAQQCLKAGLADELHIGIVPILFGSGLRFFENIDFVQIKLEKTDLTESPARTDFRYRIISGRDIV